MMQFPPKSSPPALLHCSRRVYRCDVIPSICVFSKPFRCLVCALLFPWHLSAPSWLFLVSAAISSSPSLREPSTLLLVPAKPCKLFSSESASTHAGGLSIVELGAMILSDGSDRFENHGSWSEGVARAYVTPHLPQPVKLPLRQGCRPSGAQMPTCLTSLNLTCCEQIMDAWEADWEAKDDAGYCPPTNAADSCGDPLSAASRHGVANSRVCKRHLAQSHILAIQPSPKAAATFMKGKQQPNAHLKAFAAAIKDRGN